MKMKLKYKRIGNKIVRYIREGNNLIITLLQIEVIEEDSAENVIKWVEDEG